MRPLPFLRRTVRAVRIAATDRRIPRPLRWLAGLGLLPIPGPFDEIVLVIAAVPLALFYRRPLADAWRRAGGMNSEAWDRRYAGSELLWTAQPNRFLVAEAAGLPPGRALDVACGEGRNAVWLAEQGWRVTGVDFSGVALAKARTLAGARSVDAEWLQADLVEHEPERAAYDLAIVLYLQVPAPERRTILRRTAAALAAGGVLLVVAHDSSNLERGWGGPQDPAVLYTAADVTADLEGAGVEVERAETVERPVETPEGEKVALDVLLRARAGS